MMVHVHFRRHVLVLRLRIAGGRRGSRRELCMELEVQLKMAGRAICDLQDKRQADMEVFDPQIAAQGRFAVSLHKTSEQLQALLAGQTNVGVIGFCLLMFRKM